VRAQGEAVGHARSAIATRLAFSTSRSTIRHGVWRSTGSGGEGTIATLCLTCTASPPTNRYRAHLAKMHAPGLGCVLSFFGWVIEFADQHRSPKSRL